MVIKIRKFDKKAQGYSTTELLVTLGVIITVALIAWGFYTNWSFLAGKQALLPGDVEVLGQECVALGVTVPHDHCVGFKPVTATGKGQRVTCDYLREKNLYPNIPFVDCAGLKFNVAQQASETCTNLKLSGSYLINGVSCDTWKSRATAIGTAAGESCKGISKVVCTTVKPVSDESCRANGCTFATGASTCMGTSLCNNIAAKDDCSKVAGCSWS